MTDVEYGLMVLQEYINQHVALYGGGWTSAKALAKEIQPLSPDVLIDGVGFGYRVQLEDERMNYSKLKIAMRELAQAGKGKTPTRNSFFWAIGQQSKEYTFFEAATATATGTAGQILKGAEAVGNKTLSALEFLNSILPLAIIGGVAYVFVSWTKRAAGK